VKRALILAPLQIAQAVIGFGAIALFTRLMSAEEYGRYAIALSLSMLAHTLLFTWAEAAAFRFSPKARSESAEPDHFATLLAMAGALGVATFALLCAALQFADIGEAVALASFAVGAAFLRFVIRLARESDRAALDLQRYAIAEAAYLVLGFGGGIAALVSFDLGASGPFIGLLLAGILVAAWDTPALFARARGGRVDSRRVLAYAGYGAPLALALCIDMAVQAGARLMLADAAGADAVGAYAAAWGLARPLDIAFMSLSAMLAPRIFHVFETSTGDAHDAAQSMFISFAAFAAPCAAALALMAPQISEFMLGAPLREAAAQTLPWLAAAGLCSGFNLYYWSEAFQLTGRTGLRATLLLAPAAVQLALTAYLAPLAGAIGAAAAALAGTLLGAVILAAAGSRLFALPIPLGALARIGGAVCFMAIILVAARPFGFFAMLAYGGSAYGLGVLMFNVADMRSQARRALAPLLERMRAHAH
jgi:O-antigen/teichoic acid export membrane protein